MKQAYSTDDFYLDDFDTESIDDQPTTIDNDSTTDWTSLTLTPVEEDEPDFSAQEDDLSADIITLNDKQSEDIGFQLIRNRYRRKYDNRSRQAGLSFEVDWDTEALEVDLDKFSKIVDCFTDEMFEQPVSSIISMGRTQGDEYNVRICGYLDYLEYQGSRNISRSLKAKANSLGMQLDYFYKPGKMVVYEIVVKKRS